MSYEGVYNALMTDLSTADARNVYYKLANLHRAQAALVGSVRHLAKDHKLASLAADLDRFEDRLLEMAQGCWSEADKLKDENVSQAQ